MRRLPLVLAALLLPSVARADMLPDGYKGVKLSLRVDAEVPADKALVVANTFRGGTIVAPNTDQPLEWHPLGGAMQLKLIAADKVDAIKKNAEALDRDASKPILAAAVECAAPFEGVRTIVDTSPAVEVRWTYRATVKGNTCTAELVKQEYLDAGGKAVPAPPAENPNKGPTSAPLADPPAPPTPPATPAPPTPPAKAAEPTKAAEPAAEKSGMCSVSTARPGLSVVGDPASGLAWLAALVLVARRRRQS